MDDESKKLLYASVDSLGILIGYLTINHKINDGERVHLAYILQALERVAELSGVELEDLRYKVASETLEDALELIKGRL